MFSSNIKLMTGDAHSILDSEGKRVNYSNDIVVEDHVWLCTQTMVLKGAHIPANSIVGAYSLVTKKYDGDHLIIAGNPAKVVKSISNWERRI